MSAGEGPAARAGSVRVRPMAGGDAEAVAALAGQLGYPAGAAEVGRRIAALAPRAEAALFVAEGAGGEVLGWAAVESRLLLETGTFAELTGLVVDSGARGGGAGRALVAAAEAWARAGGQHVLRVRSNVVRRQARAFYERLGYAVIKSQNVFQRALDEAGAGMSEGRVGARDADAPGPGSAPPAG